MYKKFSIETLNLFKTKMMDEEVNEKNIYIGGYACSNVQDCLV